MGCGCDFNLNDSIDVYVIRLLLLLLLTLNSSFLLSCKKLCNFIAKSSPFSLCVPPYISERVYIE